MALEYGHPESNGAEDAFYDARSRSVVFCGGVPCALEGVGASQAMCCSYSLRDRSLWIWPLPATAEWGTSVYARPGGPSGTIYGLSYTSDEPRRSVVMEFPARCLGDAKVLESSPTVVVCFARSSPNGRLIAWLRDVSKDEHTRLEMVLYDTVSRSRRVIARMSSYGSDLLRIPPDGCPFCWSPNGDRIAYADGASIKFVKIPPSLPAATRKR